MELCIDFGGTEIKLAVIDGMQVLSSRAVPVHGDAADLASAADTARALIAATGTPTAAGIAVPGVVDPTTGRMLHANAKYDFLRDLDLQDWSRTELGLPAIVENDARAALIGEADASGERDVVLVTLGTGIGTAAMIDGVALRGRSGHAGILGGHVTTDVDGPICPCGNIGCAEALAGTRALEDLAPGLTMRGLFADDTHRELRDRFLHVWGSTVVTLIHMYDPAAVVLSGGILRAGDAVREPIENHVRAHLWPSITPPRLIVPPEPELSVARGLSILARGTTSHHDQEDQ